MKNILKYTLFLSLVLLCACGSDEEWATVAQQHRSALELRIGISDFTTYGDAPSTRASDSGATTTFENGDRVGVIVLEGSALKGNNLPYIYNDGSWSFDANQVNSENSSTNGSGGNKSLYYYDSKATDVTYIVYYPYSTAADGVTTIDGLKSKFTPKENQQSAAAYRVSDLMTWQSVTSTAPLKKLAATLHHAYNSVSLLPVVHYTFNGKDFYYLSSGISDVNFVIGDKLYLPYAAADGSYRCILPSGLTEGDVRCFCTFDDKTYSKVLTVSSESSAASNIRYSSTQKVSAGDYTLAMAQVGDFYCRSGDGNSSTGYLIPRDAASLTTEQKAACLGIVMKVSKDGSGAWEDKDDYKQKDGSTSMSTIHGYVLALKDGNGGNTCAWSPYDIQVSTNQEQYTLFRGYSNTQTIKTYVSQNHKNLQSDFPATYYATVGYEASYPAPSNSSGWFLPSAGQCWYWCQNRDALKQSMDKAGGDGWQNCYWSSSERDLARYAWVVFFYYGDVSYDNKDRNYNNWVRSCLAF